MSRRFILGGTLLVAISWSAASIVRAESCYGSCPNVGYVEGTWDGFNCQISCGGSVGPASCEMGVNCFAPAGCDGNACVESPSCTPDGNCSAGEPACGGTSSGVDNCGNVCTLIGSACPTTTPTSPGTGSPAPRGEEGNPRTNPIPGNQPREPEAPTAPPTPTLPGEEQPPIPNETPCSGLGYPVGMGGCCDGAAPEQGVCVKACATMGEPASSFSYGCCEGAKADDQGVCTKACATMGEAATRFSYGCCDGAAPDEQGVCVKACAAVGESAAGSSYGCCSGAAPGVGGVCQLACAPVGSEASAQPGGCCSGAAVGENGICELVCAQVGELAQTQPGGCCSGASMDENGVCALSCAGAGQTANSQPAGCCAGSVVDGQGRCVTPSGPGAGGGCPENLDVGVMAPSGMILVGQTVQVTAVGQGTVSLSGAQQNCTNPYGLCGATFVPTSPGDYLFTASVTSCGRTVTRTVNLHVSPPIPTSLPGSMQQTNWWFVSAAGSGQVRFFINMGPIPAGWEIASIEILGFGFATRDPDCGLNCYSLTMTLNLNPAQFDANGVYINPNVSPRVTLREIGNPTRTTGFTLSGTPLRLDLQPAIVGSVIKPADNTGPLTITVTLNKDGVDRVLMIGTGPNGEQVVLGYAIQTGPRTWVFTPGLSAGTYNVAIVAVDQYGHSSPGFYDTATPRVSFTLPAQVGGVRAQLIAPSRYSRTIPNRPVQVIAEAFTDRGSQVEQVIFWALGPDGNKTHEFATLSAPPYEATWIAGSPGMYMLFARAVDSRGYVGIASGVPIYVDTAPVVVILEPTANSVVSNSTSTTILLKAMDLSTNGRVERVDVLVDSSTVGRATWIGQSSYTFTWNPSTPGLHWLGAVVTSSRQYTGDTVIPVYVSSGGMLPPILTQQPRDLSVKVGQSAFFSVGVIAQPAAQYQWEVRVTGDFVAIPGATSSFYSIPRAGPSHHLSQYRCRVNNTAGQILSEAAVLTVQPAEPLQVVHPGHPKVGIGGQATFEAKITGGVAPYQIQWQSLAVGATQWMDVPGATGTLHSVWASTFTQHGIRYRYRVLDNQPGTPNTLESPAGTLNVLRLTIGYSPVSLSVVAGQPATFVVGPAYGLPPYHYQWQWTENGVFVNIPEAPDHYGYSFTPRDATWSGKGFRCLVRDALGDQAASEVSILSVIVPRAQDDAAVVSMLPIPRLEPGSHSFAGLVTVRNIGYSTWTYAGGFKLGSQNPADNKIWGFDSVPLDPQDVILPGMTKSFFILFTAPARAGYYTFAWQMKRGDQFFGDPTETMRVQVGDVEPKGSLTSLPDQLPVNGVLAVQPPAGVKAVLFRLSPVLETERNSSKSTPAASAAWTATYPAGQEVDFASLRLLPGEYVLEVAWVYEGGATSEFFQKNLTLVSPVANAVRVYPNPWRVDQHRGHDVTFDGLSEGSKVKLFTIAGHRVKTLTATGTVVSWDLTNESGDRVQSGIYLYVVTDNPGGKVRGKLVVIR